jgi:hypothetical protein
MTHHPPNLSRRLTRYSLAAGAAGLAAGADQADAAIQVFDNGGAGWTVNDNQKLYFTYTGTVATAPGTGAGIYLYNNGDDSRGAVFVGGDNRLITGRLGASAPVPGTTRYQTVGNLFTVSGSNVNGWYASDSGYLGLVFDVAGTKYYGWLDITLDAYNPSGDTIVVNRFAVDDVANTPIITGDTGGGSGDGSGGGGGSSAVPEPGTLALLLLGATGLTALRRRET